VRTFAIDQTARVLRSILLRLAATRASDKKFSGTLREADPRSI
jgi:hypothetical protein